MTYMQPLVKGFVKEVVKEFVLQFAATLAVEGAKAVVEVATGMLTEEEEDKVEDEST